MICTDHGYASPMPVRLDTSDFALRPAARNIKHAKSYSNVVVR